MLEALPYIQRFRSQIFVVKYGGSFMDSPDPEERHRVARDIVFLEAVGINPVVDAIYYDEMTCDRRPVAESFDTAPGGQCSNVRLPQPPGMPGRGNVRRQLRDGRFRQIPVVCRSHGEARCCKLAGGLEFVPASPVDVRPLACRPPRRQLAGIPVVVETFHQAVLMFLAFHPRHAELARRLARAVTEHATPVGSGTVARTRRWRFIRPPPFRGAQPTLPARPSPIRSMSTTSAIRH